MSRPYSIDLRQRVIEAAENGQSAHQAAKRFDVGVSTAVLWIRRFRENGESLPRKSGKPPGSRLDPHADYLLALIEQNRDLTLTELVAALEHERGVRVGLTTMWKFLAQRGLTFKKNSARRRAATPGREASP
jgi:transposase